MNTDLLVARFQQTTIDLLDYQINWQLPEGDTIESVRWIAEEGVTIGTGTHAPRLEGASAIAWLSAAVEGVFTVSCVVTTTSGRRIERQIQLTVVKSFDLPT